jgi:heterotetrameric sarcosine oxidase gamma subunit
MPVSSLDVRPAPVPAHAGTAGITLSERSGLSICSVVARTGRARDLAGRVQAMFGIDLPDRPRHTGAGSIAFVGAGPGQWLALAADAEPLAFERRLRAELAGLASVADESDGRTIVRIAGARARDMLAKGLLVDLHPRAFGPGSAATTMVAHMRVQLWQLDAHPTYEFAVPRSFAVSWWDWVIEAGAEYGIEIVTRHAILPP